MASIGDERVLPSVAATWGGLDPGASSPPSPAEERRYRELGLLGRGGLGEVIEVFDVDLERRVALKRPRDGRVEPSVARALVREAQITAGLEHPGIPSVHALGVDGEDRPFFTMERLDGVTLAELLARGPIRQAAALRMWMSVAWAIAFAHDRKVVHRDLKPSNVMIGEFGQVHVVDWGIASPLADPAPPAFSGTPAYASPEQLAGLPLDPRMDVYALGALLYELLSGRPPVVASSPAEALDAVQRVGIPPLSSVARVSPVLADIVHRGLAARPDDRYPSVVAFLEDVQAWLDGAAVLAGHEAPLSRFGRLYFARSRRLRRFRWVDVDLWMASATLLGAAVALGVSAHWLPWLGGWALASALGSLGFFLPPAWTLFRPDRPDDVDGVGPGG